MEGIASSLISTKLRRPQLPSDLVPRPHLVARLNAGLNRPLTLFSAPAGFGKTSLLSQWLEQCSLPSAWLSLDEGDSDFAVFLSYVLAAIRALFPDACADTFDMLRAPKLPPLEVIVTSLINDIESLPQRFVLVLDDFHLAQSKSVSDIVSHLLRHPPRQLHLVMTSRQDPLLPLAALRARAQITELRAVHLRFSAAETHSYLRPRLGVARTEALGNIIAHQTEGWPAGVSLAALSAEDTEDARDLLTQMPKGGAYMADYLVEEVLASLSPTTEDFLLKTSILERFCAGLGDTLMGGDSSQRQLGELQRLNLIVGLDERHEWYRYHHLFRDLLRHRLQLRSSGQPITDLHRQASAWFATHGWVEEALHHALVGDDPEMAARLIERHWVEIINQEDWPRLDRWLRQLPPDIVETSPQLLMARVWSVLVHQLDLSEIHRLLDKIDAFLNAGPDGRDEQEKRGLRAEVAMLRSQDCYWQGDEQGSIVFARQAIVLAPPTHANLLGMAYVYLGLALQMAGDLTGAYAALHNGLARDRDQGNNYLGRVLTGLCGATWLAGDLARLAGAGARLLKVARERNLVLSPGLAHFYLGAMHYQRHELEAAVEHFRAVEQRAYLTNRVCAVHSLFGLALTRQAQGRLDDARGSAEAAFAFALEHGTAGMLAEADAFRAHLALLQGDLATATHWAEHFDGQFAYSPLLFLEVPQLTLAQVLLTQQTSESLVAAGRVLQQLDLFVQRTHKTRYRIDVLALTAVLHQARGEHGEAVAAVEAALRLAEPGGYVRVFLDLGDPMINLLRQLAAQNRSSAYLERILAAAPSAALELPALEPRLTIPLDEPPARPSQVKHPELIEGLTYRELEVLALLAQRLSDKEIAALMVVSISTVKKHSANIYQKLHVNGRREAVFRAKALNLI